MSCYRIAYVMNHSLPTVTEADTKALTHINLAFALIQNGQLDLGQLTNLGLASNFRTWNPGLKLILSVGGWEADGFSQAAMTEDGRKRFADSCRSVVQQYDLDGIDIDWEYPCSDAAGIAADPRDRENFTLLLNTIRKAIGKEKILSVAMGAEESCAKNTEMDKVSQILDYVQLMTYDMVSAPDTHAGHHAALYPARGDRSRNNVRDVVAHYHSAGVPYEKMVIGAAFYTRDFEVNASENNGLLQPSGPGLFAASYHDITPDYLEKHGFTEYWDPDAGASYLWNGKTFSSFESPRAIRLKCQFVKKQGLAGLMYWEHGHDQTKALLGTIQEALG